MTRQEILVLVDKHLSRDKDSIQCLNINSSLNTLIFFEELTLGTDKMAL